MQKVRTKEELEERDGGGDDEIGEQQDEEEEIVTGEELEDKWDLFWREYTMEERRILCAKCIQVGVEVAFNNHVYWYHNELYRQ